MKRRKRKMERVDLREVARKNCKFCHGSGRVQRLQSKGEWFRIGTFVCECAFRAMKKNLKTKGRLSP